MAKYEPGEIVTFYFVVKRDKENIIKGWTDKKKLADYYMKFHNHPDYFIQEITRKIEDMNKIMEDNYHDEIVLTNLFTRGDKEGKLIIIPATSTEINLIREESNSFFASRIDYSYLDGSILYLKKKYRRALEKLFLNAVIEFVIYNRQNAITTQIDLDQLMLLIRAFPNDFS